MSMEKRIEVKVPWHIIIPTIIVCSILGTTTSLLTKGSLVWLFNLQTTLYVLNFTPTPYILLTIIFILAFYSNSIRQKINVHTLVFMYTAALIATSFSGVMIPWRNWGNFFTDRVADPDIYTSKLPLFWMPAYEFVLPSRLGGVAVPWGPWIPALAFWILFYCIVFLYQTSWASLLRRQWIDIDEVPFPYVLAQSALISSAKSGKSDKSRLTMIGILIGLIIYVVAVMNSLFPWFPDIFGWVSGQLYYSWTAGGLNAPRAFPGIASIMVGFVCINTNPVCAAVAFLAPMDVQLSVWMFNIIFIWIIPQIAYAMGYYSGILSQFDNWARSSRFQTQFPLMYEAFSSVGGSLALFTSWFFLNRKYLSSTIRLALQKEKSELEINEPLAYRLLYLMWGGSAIILIALLMISGIGLNAAILTLVTLFVFGFVHARLHGLVGYDIGGWNYGNTFLKLIWPPGSVTLETMDQSYLLSHVLNQRFFCDEWSVMGFGAMYPLSAYKMGTLNQVSNKSIFKVIVVAVIISPVIAFPLGVWMLYTFGTTKLPGFPGGWGLLPSVAPSVMDQYPGVWPWWPQALLGFIAVFTISVLRSRFTWFPVEPLGLMLSTNCAFWYSGYWSMFLVAWVLKLATLKIGGGKLYEEKAVPFVIGFIAGYALSIIFTIAVSIFRFFIPF